MDLSALHSFRVAACDLNGQMRGKRVPPSYADKAGRWRSPNALFGAEC